MRNARAAHNMECIAKKDNVWHAQKGNYYAKTLTYAILTMKK